MTTFTLCYDGFTKGNLRNEKKNALGSMAAVILRYYGFKNGDLGNKKTHAGICLKLYPALMISQTEKQMTWEGFINRNFLLTKEETTVQGKTWLQKYCTASTVKTHLTPRDQSYIFCYINLFFSKIKWLDIYFFIGEILS